MALYDYGSRWYDAYLNRFLQPDSIIPDPYNPLSYDRYAYAWNSPTNFNDPTGHAAECGIAGDHCGELPSLKEATVVVQAPSNVTDNLEELGEQVGSFLFEPVDYFLTAKECVMEGCSPIVLLAVLPFVFGKMANNLGDVAEITTGIARKYDPKAFGHLDDDIRLKVFERDDFTCQYCGKRGGDLEVDHFKSKKQIWEEGASEWAEEERNKWLNDMDNLVTSCRNCNASKGSTNPFDWLISLFTGSKGTGK